MMTYAVMPETEDKRRTAEEPLTNLKRLQRKPEVSETAQDAARSRIRSGELKEAAAEGDVGAKVVTSINGCVEKVEDLKESGSGSSRQRQVESLEEVASERDASVEGPVTWKTMPGQ